MAAATFRPARLLFLVSAVAVRALARLYCRIEVEGLERRPPAPFVAIFNHSSTVDVAVMAHVVPGPVCYWAKAELKDKGLVGWWLGACGAVFVQRGRRDEAAFGEALARLRAGLPFFLAPEGTRHHGEAGGRPRTGFVRLAQLGRVPVLPCAITGAREALPPGTRWPRLRARPLVRVRIGEARHLPELPADEEHREALSAQAAGLMAEIYRMKAELEREGAGPWT